MKEINKETIEIDGKEYTLFLNRKGLVSFENITKISKKTEKLKEEYETVLAKAKEEGPIEVKDTDNPFDYASDAEIEQAEKLTKDLEEVYVKFYWIALYENHKLPLSEVSKLFDKAKKEYGIEQLVLLANQIIDEVNEDRYGKPEIKKLKALHQQI